MNVCIRSFTKRDILHFMFEIHETCYYENKLLELDYLGDLNLTTHNLHFNIKAWDKRNQVERWVQIFHLLFCITSHLASRKYKEYKEFPSI